MLVIIDADPIVYRSGFAAETVTRHLVYSIAGEDEIYDVWFEPRVTKEGKRQTALDQQKEFIEKTEDIEVLDDESVVIPEPKENALHNVRQYIRDCIYNTARHFGISTDEVRLRVLLSGPGNFRYDIATVKPYKGNRKQDHKPHWYSECRKYLQRVWDAQVVEGREADDECAILQYQSQGPSIICTFDKDLDMVPGWHYDYNKKTFYHTDPDEGMRFFYTQALSGDSTDNIPGCYMIGKEKAEKFVEGWCLEHGPDWKGLWAAIVEKYEESAEKYGTKCPYWSLYEEAGAEAVALEMARLVWMQEYPDQLWTPPGEPDELLEREDEL